MRVFNKKYWPHQIILQHTGVPYVDTLERYCYETFKSANWRNHGLYFVFKNGEDCTLFALRWA